MSVQDIFGSETQNSGYPPKPDGYPEKAPKAWQIFAADWAVSYALLVDLKCAHVSRESLLQAQEVRSTSVNTSPDMLSPLPSHYLIPQLH